MSTRCKNCGSMDVMDELQWDTVVGHECCDCGYYWSIGFVGGFPGEHYFVPYQEHLEDYDDLEDTEEHPDKDLADSIGISVEALEVLTRVQQDDYIDDDDDELPF